MGLTIHYNLKTSAKTTAGAKAIVEKMRQLALDLPFEHVDNRVRYYGPKQCQQPLESVRSKPKLFSALLDAGTSISIPWMKGTTLRIQPTEIFLFDAIPGPGSEWLTLGLARYADEIEVDYDPMEDDRFRKSVKDGGMVRKQFDGRRWEKWLVKNGHPWKRPSEFAEKRKIKTRKPGWRFGTFCKTQYASEPAAGGIPNFIRCHLCAIHLLDRIAKLPTVKVDYNDEGKYGPSNYTDDPWAKNRVYTWHPGKYNVKALIEEVGEWNEMIAAAFGGWQDLANAAGVDIQAPITKFGNFEQLEFRGQNQEQLAPFLTAMKQLAEQSVKVEQ
jgi:hypothetical protein